MINVIFNYYSNHINTKYASKTICIPSPCFKDIVCVVCANNCCACTIDIKL